MLRQGRRSPPDPRLLGRSSRGGEAAAAAKPGVLTCTLRQQPGPAARESTACMSLRTVCQGSVPVIRPRSAPCFGMLSRAPSA